MRRLVGGVSSVFYLLSAVRARVYAVADRGDLSALQSVIVMGSNKRKHKTHSHSVHLCATGHLLWELVHDTRGGRYLDIYIVI